MAQIDTSHKKNLSTTSKLRMHESWKAYLEPEFDTPALKSLKSFLQQEIAAGKAIFPKGEEYFAALNTTPFDKVKVVILGQDPYHGAGQAHGLSFSVKKGVDVPPSLMNIYKELKSDLAIEPARHGFLEAWAQQGVLLLNSVLTVEQGRAASHQGKGWELFTDKIIQVLNEHRSGVVFVLWGSYAQKKASFVDRKKHLVIESPHPSPLSAYRGFLGSRPFSKINDWLKKHDQETIEWRLEE